ncbi:MAG: zinc-ribbon domain-containing protein [Wolbachia endosymbiont of Meromenopon meropis]|nr:zinc-ribbon domain-containing protein [Wolbachia endosymbiont of Meromenopon meropis]
MKIQCGNCAKIYLVSSEQIGKLGRKVKCTNCNYMWHEHLKESYELHSNTTIQKKKILEKSFLILSALAFVVVSVLCITITNYSRESDKIHKIIDFYKSSISYKLGCKKKQTNDANIEDLATSKFCQDYLFLTNLRSN